VLVKASLDAEAYIIAGVALVVGLLTIYSMTKIWGNAFWKPHPGGVEPKLSALTPRDRAALLVPIGSLAVLTCIIGFFPEPFVVFAERSAEQLLDPTAYIVAVLGEMPEIAEGAAELEAVE
jgi:multicomponent Na+:H+ antiporter subunit D